MLEQALRHAQKMEAVGTLASGVAHNLRNVLQAIMGSIEVSRSLAAAGQPAGQMLDRATGTAKKAAALIDQLMMFARKQEDTVSLSPVHLDDAIRDAAALIKPLLGNAIALEIDAGAPFGVVMADPMQLEQIFLNLAANARDAMPRGGIFTITSRDALLDEPRARAHGRSPALKSRAHPVPERRSRSVCPRWRAPSSRELPRAPANRRDQAAGRQ